MTHHPKPLHRFLPVKVLWVLLACLLVHSQALSQVLISEFMASNSSIPDPAGDFDDWIELYNQTDQPVDVGGLFLTDDLTRPNQWQFPNNRPDITIISAKGYLLVWADDDVNQGPLHTTFKLSQSGEQIGLFSANGTVIDSLTYPAQQINVSWAFDDVLNQWYAAPYATPGLPNAQASARVVISEIMYNPAIEWERPEDPNREYIELLNAGNATADLSGWALSRGVSYTFPDQTQLLPGEYLVVTSHPETLLQYGLPHAYGPWVGGLSNQGETLELVDATGSVVNRLRYADQGDWAQRIQGPSDQNHRGWLWHAEHDGQGKSLELINTATPNTYGQNWRASLVYEGTPGTVNSVSNDTLMPLIKDVEQTPKLPTSKDDVQITGSIENGSGVLDNVTLFYRVDQSQYVNERVYPLFDPNTYTSVRMQDAGNHRFQATIPALASGTIVEFCVFAQTAQSYSQTWPAPAMMDGEPQQVTNALYQINDAWDHLDPDVPGNQPVYYVIMTEMERARLADIGDREGGEYNSDAQMNATFVSVQGQDVDLRYNVSVRNRGHGSRNNLPNNMRVNFKHDEPWHSVSAISINSQYGYRQVIGSALFQLAGLPVAQAKLVQLRVNGDNLAVSGDLMYGSYAHVEVINSDFANRLFPDDNNGNIYKCMRDGGPGADLVYRGASPSVYQQNYFKQSNKAKDDWSDLYDLTFKLTSSRDDTYLSDIRSRVHVEAWLTYLALNELLGNTETTLSNGSPDDYYLYAGTKDPRFYLIQHDLDSIFQRSGVNVFRFWELQSLARMIGQSPLTSQYYRTLDELMSTIVSPDHLRQVFSLLSLSGVPDSALEGMISYATNRYTSVRSQIHGSLTLDTTLRMGDLFYESAGNSVVLFGEADPVSTGSILVNGHLAQWSPLDGVWSLGSRNHPEQGIDTLQPGLTRVTAQAFDGPNGTGRLVDTASIDIAHRIDVTTDLSGLLDTDTWLSASAGPYRVTDRLTVPEGVMLSIEAGATLFFESTAGITVRSGGCIQALGTEGHAIRMTRTPTSDTNWQGLFLDHTREDNRLCFIEFEQGDAQGQSVAVEYASVLLDHVTFGGTSSQVLELHHPSAMIRHCAFPSVTTETIHGSGLSGDESLVFDSCVFGPTLGTSDIIDFTGGARPGPILQCYNCVFLGGADDGLDLDGTDAHIQGNQFMNFLQNNNSDDTANAVAAGQGDGHASQINLAENVFLNNDYDVLLKEGCAMVAQNNTFLNTSRAAISFGEPYRDPPRSPGYGAFLSNNLFWNNASIFEHYFQTSNLDYGPEVLTSDYCIVPEIWHGLGSQNMEADPMVALDGTLDVLSPAIGSGVGGTTIGAAGASSLTFFGLPFEQTCRASATVFVSGPGITHYIFCLNDPNGQYSKERSVEEPILLSDLASGQSCQIHAIGKNSAGLWQDAPTSSMVWQVQTNHITLTLNEILVTNQSLDLKAALPSFIELYFDGPAALSVGRVSLSRNANRPDQFTLASGGTLLPDSLVQVPLDDRLILNPAGDTLHLFLDNVLMDSLTFGAQLPNLSIGCVGANRVRRMTHPTPGQINVPASTGNPRLVTINEWLAFQDTAFDSDFVELHNPSPWPVNMNGFYLTDNPLGKPTKFAFPPFTLIDANSVLVLVPDGNTAPGHLPFKLSAEGEILGLLDAELNAMDTVLFGPQWPDISQGRTPDGSDNFEWFENPTPGLVNPNRSPPVVVVQDPNLAPFEQAWSYMQDNQPLGGPWMNTTFDDSTWPTGQGLLYVENSDLPVTKNTPLTHGATTYYFRTQFTLDRSPDMVESLSLETMIDDGAIVYLNGQEILRLGMPEGNVDHDTLANRTIGNAGIEGPFLFDTSLLIQGTNTLAAEVHQTSATSSDVVWGLSLTALGPQEDL